jgi:hypothetical protein
VRLQPNAGLLVEACWHLSCSETQEVDRVAAYQHSVKTMNACEMLARYIELHNQAAAGADDRTSDLFAAGVRMDVEGESLSQLRRDAIIGRFRAEELVLWEIATQGDEGALAKYAWRRHPQLGGIVEVQVRDDRIARMILRPGRSRLFALLASTPPPPISSEGPDAFRGD